MRVPLVVRYDRLMPTKRKERRVALNIDYAETFAKLAGATPDPGVEGVSLVPLLAKSAIRWRTATLNEHWNGAIPTFAQVRGKFRKPGDVKHVWKYVELVTGEKELYNEDHDPFELTNVVADPANAALVATMAARLRELDPGWTGSAQAAPSQGAAGPDYMDDDALE
jgi:arylsulfatase A-like enzyme